MNFEETPIQSEIRELTRKFSKRELLPLIHEDEKNEIFRPEMIRRMGELGLTGIPIPSEFGGAGLGYQEYTVAIEELAQASISYAISVAVTGLAQVILDQFGSENQKRKYIPLLAGGTAIGAFSLSEAFSGSDASSLRTTAKKVGNHYFVNGTKQWTTQGDIADTIILLARTGDRGPNGISALIVEKGMNGFSCGKREKKMGCHISHTMELTFNNVRIPEENRVGREGDGFKIAMVALNSGRITVAAAALGLAAAALRIAMSHAQQREQFGKPIIEFQGVSFILADMAIELEAARLLVGKAAWLKDQGQPFTRAAAIAKTHATDMAMRVTTDAVQILGGSGYTQDFPLERYMREAKALQIVEGTNQIQRMIIARELASNVNPKKGSLSWP